MACLPLQDLPLQDLPRLEPIPTVYVACPVSSDLERLISSSYDTEIICSESQSYNRTSFSNTIRSGSKDNGFVKLPPHRPFDRKIELKPGEERIPLLLLEIYDRDPRISGLGLHKDLYDRGLC